MLKISVLKKFGNGGTTTMQIESNRCYYCFRLPIPNFRLNGVPVCEDHANDKNLEALEEENPPDTVRTPQILPDSDDWI